MSVDRALRSVIRGILNEQDGPNDPRMPDEPAYTQLPSRIGIAAMLLPTAYKIFQGFEDTGIVQNDFPIINMQSLSDAPTQNDIATAIQRDYDSLNSLYDTIQGYGTLGWPVEKGYWKDLSALEQQDVKDLVGQVMEPKSSTRVVSAYVVNKIDKTGDNNPSRLELIDFIVKYLEENHKLFQQKVKSLNNRSSYLADETASFNNTVKHFKSL